MKQIRVHAVYYKDRSEWLIYYRDPITKRRQFKGTAITGRDARSKGLAAECATKWQSELREAQTNIPWKTFRRRYEDERLSSLASGTDRKVFSVFNSIERILNPARLSDITTEAVSRYQTQLRVKGIRGKPLSENTIATHLAHLKAALNWAIEMRLLTSAPKIKRPQRAKSSRVMKGRPITSEEFERMIGKVPTIVGKRASASWKFYLKGLWWSGLRLGESLELYWDRDDKLKPLLDGQNSCLMIPADHEKGNRDRILPMAPEFVKFLEKTPASKRKGPVFRPLGETHTRLGADRVGHVISAIGKAAGVVVDYCNSTGQPKKFASAHDLRRAFGERWSKRIMPTELKQLMRHESIETTLRYYVGENAKQTARSLWEAFIRSNTNPSSKKKVSKQRSNGS